MTETKQFDFASSAWRPSSDGTAKTWIEILERTGPEVVRAKLANLDARIGSAAAIPIGTETGMTVGFIQEWVAWSDRRIADSEQQRQESMKTATFWAAVAAGLSAIGAIAQAFVAGLAYWSPPPNH